MFEVGQKVVYPNHGVTMVEEIGNSSIDGVEQTYYHLRLLSNDSKVMVPEENLDLVGLRCCSSCSAETKLAGVLTISPGSRFE